MKIGNAAEQETIVKNNYGKDRLENGADKEKQEKNQKKSIDASGLNLCQDSIAEKKKKAMQDAMDFIKQQFESDSHVDEALEECRGQIEEGKEQALAASKELKSIQEQKEQLKEEYPDGGEDYDAYMKELNEMESCWRKEMAKGQSLVADSTSAIKAMKQEALKHHGMTDAFKAAEETMKAASDEMIGMLMNEAKDTVDKELEETVEQAEEAKEEQAEQEEDMKEAQVEQEKKVKELEEELEKRRRARESRSTPPSAKEHAALMQDLQNRQKEIIGATQQILEEATLLPEEIKGIMVDLNI
ncbi:MAG: hypothetical protein HFH52_11455 [Lachnospiraceae bacterium]|nr:hypothetical protein [Lachnospiraceae bacterium]